MMLKLSPTVHIQALYSTDGIQPGSSSKLQLLVLNLAEARVGQLVNSPLAQSRNRKRSLKTTTNKPKKIKVNYNKKTDYNRGFALLSFNEYAKKICRIGK